MGEIKGFVPGGCPKCGEPDLIVPEFYTRDTPVNCPHCGALGTWGQVFDPKNEDPKS